MGKRLTVSNGDIRDDDCSHTYARYEPVGEGDAILVGVIVAGVLHLGVGLEERRVVRVFEAVEPAEQGQRREADDRRVAADGQRVQADGDDPQVDDDRLEDFERAKHRKFMPAGERRDVLVAGFV